MSCYTGFYTFSVFSEKLPMILKSILLRILNVGDEKVLSEVHSAIDKYFKKCSQIMSKQSYDFWINQLMLSYKKILKKILSSAIKILEITVERWCNLTCRQ